VSQHKYLFPVLVGLLGLTSLCFVLGKARNTESVSAETVVPQAETSEHSTINPDDSDVFSQEQFVAVQETELDFSGVTDSADEIMLVDLDDEELLVDHFDSDDPDSIFWVAGPDCPEETYWTGEEIVDPFTALEEEMVFWQEAIDITFDDLNLVGFIGDTYTVPQQEYGFADDPMELSDEGYDFGQEPIDSEWFFAQEDRLALYDELVEAHDDEAIVESPSEQPVEQITGFDEFPIDSDFSVVVMDPVDLIETEHTTLIGEFDIPEESFEAFADANEHPEDFFETVEEVISSENSFESVDEVVENSAVSFETLEESGELNEDDFGLEGNTLLTVEETPETDDSSTETSTATSLFEEESRVTDLRRYATDDIHRSNWKRALDEVRELVTLRPYHADYHMTLGLVHRRLEDVLGDGTQLQEAMRKYEEYAEFGGQEAIACLLLAEAHAANGDRKNAFEFLERAASYGMNIARAVQQFPVLKKYTGDTRFVRSSLRLERYTLSSVMTRDPFTGPWSRGDQHNQTVFVGPFSTQQQQEALAAAREAMAKVEYALRNRDETAAMEAYGVIEEIGSTVARFDQPALAGELRSILERLDEVEDGIEQIRVAYLYEQARGKMEAMKKAFEEHDFNVVDRMHGEVSSLAFSIDELGDSYSTASTLVVQAADQLQQRSNIIREFLSKNAHVEGVIVAEEGSHAIIDGRWVPEGGEVFDGRLEQILRDRVVIFYKGERITQRFSRF